MSCRVVVAKDPCGFSVSVIIEPLSPMANAGSPRAKSIYGLGGSARGEYPRRHTHFNRATSECTAPTICKESDPYVFCFSLLHLFQFERVHRPRSDLNTNL